VPHLVERKAGPGGTKEITAWPVAEWSLTPTPAEPRTLGIRELKALAQLEPSLLKATSLVDESYEDLISDLTDAASAALGGMCCVVATYASHVIVCQMTPGDSDGEYFDFPYTLDDSGEPVLGDPSPVQQAYVPDTDTEGKAVEETKPYNIRRQGGTYAVVGPNGRVAGRHKTRAEAIAQMRALYANVPDARKEAISMPDDTKAQQGLARSDYAWVDADGTGHLDISDEGHVRAAMARFNQTHFDSPAAKRSAARKILARARSMNMEVADDSAVAMAAKALEEAEAKYWAPESTATILDELSGTFALLAHAHVSDLKALEHLGRDSHDGRLMQAERVQTLKGSIARAQEVLRWALAVDSGQDAQASLDYMRRQLALLEI